MQIQPFAAKERTPPHPTFEIEESDLPCKPAGDCEENLGAWVLTRMSNTPPRRVALADFATDSEKLARTVPCTYGTLYARTKALAEGIRAQGLRSGDRVLILLPVDSELYALTLALLSREIVAVLIDPAIGLRGIDRALRQTRPAAVISVDRFFRLRWLWPTIWRAPLRISRSGSGLGIRSYEILSGTGECGPRSEAIPSVDARSTAPGPVASSHTALLTFTSGSTGPPKGVDRTHGILLAQHRALCSHLPFLPSAVVWTEFPVVVLHNLACGVTTVHSAADPAARLDQLARHEVTTLCAAPATLTELVEQIEARGYAPPTVRQIFAGGAPVSPRLIRRLQRVFPRAQGRVVYGSTEAEPIASVGFRHAGSDEGEGYLVGKPIPGLEVRLADPTALEADASSAGLRQATVATGSIGEVVVRGAHVTRFYFRSPRDDHRTKIQDGDGGVWHRTGDLARFDDQGRIWLVGRIGEEIRRAGRVIFPLPIEKEIDAAAGVAACALVSHRRAPRGELVVVLSPGAPKETLHRVERWVHTHRGLEDLPVRALPSLPRERRHRSKLDRVALRRQLARGRT